MHFVNVSTCFSKLFTHEHELYQQVTGYIVAYLAPYIEFLDQNERCSASPKELHQRTRCLLIAFLTTRSKRIKINPLILSPSYKQPKFIVSLVPLKIFSHESIERCEYMKGCSRMTGVDTPHVRTRLLKNLLCETIYDRRHLLLGYTNEQMHDKFAMITRFESMSFIANILACKLKIVNNRN